jgi:hypothetical protein
MPNALSRTTLTLLLIVVLSATLPSSIMAQQKLAAADEQPLKLAVLVSYGSNSDPNPVTNKAIRLENDRYYFWKDDKLVAVNFSAPAGADNADQWDMMAKSFRWR